MNTFEFRLQGTTTAETFTDVVSFVGEDFSGQFGILAYHTRFITVLSYGLAWFRRQSQPQSYLALPGGVLSFNDNVLTIDTQRYYRDPDYHKMATIIESKTQLEEDNLRQFKKSLQQLDISLLKQLRRLD
jgi:F-type H+-transporting ATPase subunit epsilon